MVTGIQIKQHIVEGDYVATVFDMETVNGVDHVFDRIHIVDGQIKSIHAFYYSEQTAEEQSSRQYDNGQPLWLPIVILQTTANYFRLAGGTIPFIRRYSTNCP
jgi:hypothetical protein